MQSVSKFFASELDKSMKTTIIRSSDHVSIVTYMAQKCVYLESKMRKNECNELCSFERSK